MRKPINFLFTGMRVNFPILFYWKILNPFSELRVLLFILTIIFWYVLLGCSWFHIIFELTQKVWSIVFKRLILLQVVANKDRWSCCYLSSNRFQNPSCLSSFVRLKMTANIAIARATISNQNELNILMKNLLLMFWINDRGGNKAQAAFR